MSAEQNHVVSARTDVDEILASIRSKLQTQAAGSETNESSEQIEKLRQSIRSKTQGGSASPRGESFEECHKPTAQHPKNITVSGWTAVSGAFSGRFRIPSRNIPPLAVDTEELVAVHLQFGEVNPRPPGLHNRAIQLVKKLMRRSLSWYTRPQQLFQKGVIGALQQVAAALQTHDDLLQEHNDSLQRISRELASQAATLRELQEQNARLAEQLVEQRGERQALSEDRPRSSVQSETPAAGNPQPFRPSGQ